MVQEITRKITDWPYDGTDGIDDNYHRKTGRWTETTEEVYYDQMGAVPPRKMGYEYFMVGEAYDFAAFAVFVEVNNRFFGKICFDYKFSLEQCKKEIAAQFGL